MTPCYECKVEGCTAHVKHGKQLCPHHELAEECKHDYHEAMDEEGQLTEPARDICIHCGKER